MHESRILNPPFMHFLGKNTLRRERAREEGWLTVFCLKINPIYLFTVDAAWPRKTDTDVGELGASGNFCDGRDYEL